MKKQTPVQEVLESAALWRHAGAEISGGFITTVEIIHRREKEFAKACFEAGEKHGVYSTVAVANRKNAVDFDEWFKQFE